MEVFDLEIGVFIVVGGVSLDVEVIVEGTVVLMVLVPEGHNWVRFTFDCLFDE